mmetsp:Transcript_135280/g.306034  ORF Transcript_135280/g.306034 Transcript_135280/m.306034 type:complete len:335 (+) Transcript_135280:325-1329(+)
MGNVRAAVPLQTVPRSPLRSGDLSMNQSGSFLLVPHSFGPPLFPHRAGVGLYRVPRHPDGSVCPTPARPDLVFYPSEVHLGLLLWVSALLGDLQREVLDELHKIVVHLGKRKIICIPAKRIFQLHRDLVYTPVTQCDEKGEDRSQYTALGEGIHSKRHNHRNSHQRHCQHLSERKRKRHLGNLSSVAEPHQAFANHLKTSRQDRLWSLQVTLLILNHHGLRDPLCQTAHLVSPAGQKLSFLFGWLMENPKSVVVKINPSDRRPRCLWHRRVALPGLLHHKIAAVQRVPILQSVQGRSRHHGEPVCKATPQYQQLFANLGRDSGGHRRVHERNQL